MTHYNYETFDMQRELPPFLEFAGSLHVGQRAPDFPLEDLDGGKTIQMKELPAP